MAISEGIKRASGNGVAAVASGGLLGISVGRPKRQQERPPLKEAAGTRTGSRTVPRGSSAT